MFHVEKCSIMRIHLVTEINDSITRSIFSARPIFFKTIRKYIFSIVLLVEDNAEATILGTFGSMFDDWSANHVHIIAILCTVLRDCEYRKILFLCTPFLKVINLSVDKH